MRVLIYSLEGDSSGIAWQMHQEGAQVWLYIKERWARRTMDGLIPHVQTLEEGLSKNPDYILFDLNGEGSFADHLRAKGWKVINGSRLADRLEFDRAYGVKLCQQYGIKTPKTVSFNNVDEA